MSDKKNIDRLFQEKFKNFEATPGDAVWDKVHNTLNQRKERTKPIPIWWKVAGIAALLLVLVTAGNFILDDSIPEFTNPIVDNDLPISEDKKIINVDSSRVNSDQRITEAERPELVKDKINNNDESGYQEPSADPQIENNGDNYQNPRIVSSDNLEDKNIFEDDSNSTLINDNQSDTVSLKTSNRLINSNKKDNVNTKLAESLNNPNIGINDEKIKESVSEVTVADHTNQDNQIKNSEKNDEKLDSDLNRMSENKNIANPVVDTDKLKTNLPTDAAITEKNGETLAEESVATIEEIIEEEKEELKTNRWNISPNVSPVYFNSLGDGSSIDSRYDENSKTGDINFSYGITGSYALNDNFRIRAGINKLNLGYRTNDVFVYRGINTTTNLSAQRLSNIRLDAPEENTSFLSASSLNYAAMPDVISNNIKGSIDQEIGFIEIPVEVEYSLINNRVGLNLIGGFSTFFLNKNEVFSTVQGDRRLIGEATNLNTTSYSANIGLGLNFYFTKNIDLNFEPTFKYQLNTFNNTSGDFRPYVIGVYSGLRFKF